MLTSAAQNPSPTGSAFASASTFKPLPRTQHGPVVLAFDGQPHEYLFNAAEYAGARLASDVRVVCATEPVPLEVTGFAEVPVSIDLTSERAELQRASAKVAIREWNVDADWPLRTEIGSVANVVTDYAENIDASLIVLGQGRHNLVDRAFGIERTVRVASTTRVPLLAVHRDESVMDAGGFPRIRTAVVGMDYSPASIRSARLAAELVVPGGKMTFVHVRTLENLNWNGWLTWETAYDAGLADDERRLRELLSQFTSIQLEFVTVHGYPAATLLEFADRLDADLIVVGTEQRTLVNRMMIGSVARRVLRDAECHVLAAPAPRVAVLAELSQDRARVLETSNADEWAQVLNQFTQRNRGRSVRVDAQRLLGTPQTQQRHTVFNGAVFEPVTQRMQFMFGESGAWHLTHSHAGTTRVVVISDAAQCDLALVVTHGDGELILVFE